MFCFVSFSIDCWNYRRTFDNICTDNYDGSMLWNERQNVPRNLNHVHKYVFFFKSMDSVRWLYERASLWINSTWCAEWMLFIDFYYIRSAIDAIDCYWLWSRISIYMSTFISVILSVCLLISRIFLHATSTLCVIRSTKQSAFYFKLMMH